jgi:hypothetical protein
VRNRVIVPTATAGQHNKEVLTITFAALKQQYLKLLKK